MSTKLRRIAGKQAIDCGTVFYPRDTHGAFQCAMKASSERKPFYVQFVPSQGGIDSMRSEGFAGNKKGIVYELHYTQEESWAGTNPPREHVTAKKCSAPLRITSGGTLTCIPAP